MHVIPNIKVLATRKGTHKAACLESTKEKINSILKAYNNRRFF